MTRTERAAFPRAVAKDRHEARNGMDKHVPKAGTGGHNWGNPVREYQLEADGLADEGLDFEPDTVEPTTEATERAERTSVSDEERANAIKFRKNALKGDGIDLAAIARTSSAVSSSPPNQGISIATDANTAVKV